MLPYRIEYGFQPSEGDEMSIALDFNAETMTPLVPVPLPTPFWAKLDFHPCPHCPLEAANAPDCPAAARLAAILDWSSGRISHEPVRLTVVTPERTISSDTTAQRAVSSLMGLILSTSGCPHTQFLRPMARFHLPLANELETIYRAASMYLLAQYFLERIGVPADLDLAGLQQRYQDLHDVNIALCGRMRAAVERDSSLNAIILLDCFAKALPAMIDEALPELEKLFGPYLSRTV